MALPDPSEGDGIAAGIEIAVEGERAGAVIANKDIVVGFETGIHRVIARAITLGGNDTGESDGATGVLKWM